MCSIIIIHNFSIMLFPRDGDCFRGISKWNPICRILVFFIPIWFPLPKSICFFFLSSLQKRFREGIIHPTNSWTWKNFAYPYSSTTRVAEKLQSHMGVSSNRNTRNGIRNFSSAEDLTIKRCVSCDSNVMRPMNEEAAKILLPKVSGWNLVKENGVMKLQKSWTVKSFLKGLEFFELVSGIAEAEGHHPDLHLVKWNNVQMEVWTHAVGGLTENDFILAAKINCLKAHHLFRNKVTL